MTGAIMLLRQWLKPPRSLLLILALLTLVSVSAVGWFGWKLLGQERLVEGQRAQDRLEQSADRIVAALHRRLAETGDRLGDVASGLRSADVPSEGLVLILAGDSLSASPAGRLLYDPHPASQPEISSDVFAAGELLEFQQPQPADAATWYEHLSGADPAVRAGALLRLARVLRRMGKTDDARRVYGRLGELDAVVAGAPAELVARHAVAAMDNDRASAAAIRHDLLRARWRLTRGQFAFYWSEAARLAGNFEPPPAALVALAEAAARVWADRWTETGPRGQTTLWAEGHPFYVIWRGSSERRAALLTTPSAVLDPIAAGSGALCAAADGEGRALAGHRDSNGRAAVRTASEGELPWTLYVTGAPVPAGGGMLSSQRFLVLGMAVMVMFLMAGTYFIARAIQREVEVSRLQSDFVSAVSHEFRSPLTSMRQLSELLAFGRVPSEERRHLYYETLVRETVRLQRLVESLLNFGRMEAGVRLYRFEPVDARALIHNVVEEFEPQIKPSGRRIELEGDESGCFIEADPEAISVALRNLVDNALKYSPDEPTVWVEWHTRRGLVGIAVRDRGVGIAASERKAIFRKFVRGSAAVAGNVKGSGVGLAMVRHIVAAHGGEIEVESDPGHGSTFTMLFPELERI